MAAVVTSLALAFVSLSPAALAHDPVPGSDHMTKKERCMAKTKCRAKRHRVHQIYRFCNTWSCVRRVNAIRAKRYDRMRKRYIRPYLGWLRNTRQCESGGNYATNTGNGFYGAYQFLISTWHSVGGSGRPDQAEPLEQDYRAVILLRTGGPGHWPVCGH